MAKQWIAFFSQTGSEIVALSESIGIRPSAIFTNNRDESKYTFHPGLRKLKAPIVMASHDRLMNYFTDVPPYRPDEVVITLHGYLRILPANFCNKFEIYNGHPGAIDLHPELKGKDPQINAWNNRQKYPIIGSVVHKCIAELDSGEVVKSVHLTNRCESLDEMYDALRLSSLTAWSFFMKEKGLCVSGSLVPSQSEKPLY